MKLIVKIVLLLMLLSEAIFLHASEESIKRRVESVNLFNNKHFAKWAEYQAHNKLTGEDRCTKVDTGESMVGEFREPGKREDLHILQIKKCSGRQPPFAVYWGLYNNNKFISGNEFRAFPFLKLINSVEFPRNKTNVESVVLSGFRKEKGKCNEYRLTVEWTGNDFAVVKSANLGANRKNENKCIY